MANASVDPLRVWYNTRCPVCDAGIRRQRRLIGAVQAKRVKFIDINDDPDALVARGARLDDVRRRLHAVDANDKLHVGIDCAIEIWRRTLGEAWIATLLSLPLVHGVARVVYDRFADVLFAWNKRQGHW